MREQPGIAFGIYYFRLSIYDLEKLIKNGRQNSTQKTVTVSNKKNSDPEYGLQHPRNDMRANSELRM